MDKMEFSKKWASELNEVPGWDTYLQPIIASDKKWWHTNSNFDAELFHIYWVMKQDGRSPEYITTVGYIARQWRDEARVRAGEPIKL